MDEPMVSLVRSAVEALFPWLDGVSLSAKSGGLRILSAASKALHLGGDAGDPAALTAQDTGGQLAHNSMDSLFYYLPPGGAAYVPVATYSAAPGPPPPTFPGTPVKLGPGSTKVTIAP